MLNRGDSQSQRRAYTHCSWGPRFSRWRARLLQKRRTGGLLWPRIVMGKPALRWPWGRVMAFCIQICFRLDCPHMPTVVPAQCRMVALQYGASVLCLIPWCQTAALSFT